MSYSFIGGQLSVPVESIDGGRHEQFHAREETIEGESSSSLLPEQFHAREQTIDSGRPPTAAGYSLIGAQLSVPVESIDGVRLGQPSSAAGNSYTGEQLTPFVQDAREQVRVPRTMPQHSIDLATQMAHYQNIVGVLNTGHGMGVAGYVETFGAMSWDEPFGSRVHAGMLDLYINYPHRYKLADISMLSCGWVLMPANFSRASAEMPVQRGDHRFFPSIFDQTMPGDHVRMVCQNLVIDGSKPWWVHTSRICRVQPALVFLP